MIKTNVTVGVGYTLDDVKDAVAAYLPIRRDELTDITLLHSSLSLKDRSAPEFKLTAGINNVYNKELRALCYCSVDLLCLCCLIAVGIVIVVEHSVFP